MQAVHKGQRVRIAGGDRRILIHAAAGALIRGDVAEMVVIQQRGAVVRGFGHSRATNKRPACRTNELVCRGGAGAWTRDHRGALLKAAVRQQIRHTRGLQRDDVVFDLTRAAAAGGAGAAHIREAEAHTKRSSRDGVGGNADLIAVGRRKVVRDRCVETGGHGLVRQDLLTRIGKVTVVVEVHPGVQEGCRSGLIVQTHGNDR